VHRIKHVVYRLGIGRMTKAIIAIVSLKANIFGPLQEKGLLHVELGVEDLSIAPHRADDPASLMWSGWSNAFGSPYKNDSESTSAATHRLWQERIVGTADREGSHCEFDALPRRPAPAPVLASLSSIEALCINIYWRSNWDAYSRSFLFNFSASLGSEWTVAFRLPARQITIYSSKAVRC